MPFFHSLNKTAPTADRDLPWPIIGITYVVALMGPLSAGPVIGVLVKNWIAILIGLLIGISITFLNAWLNDRFVDPLIARFRKHLLKNPYRIFVNIVAFAWSIALCVIAMLAPIAVLGRSILE